LEKLQRKFKHLKNIVIPLSIFTYHQDKYPQFIKKVSSLMESKKFKSVSLTTRNKEEYEMAMKAFTDLTCEMIKKNEIGA
jgi:exopolysaccharide biosynthesis predicted pyruvyltransferase EpsI